MALFTFAELDLQNSPPAIGVYMPGVLSPLVIPEFIKDQARQSRWVRISAIGTSLTAEALWTARMQREGEQRDRQEQNRFALSGQAQRRPDEQSILVFETVFSRTDYWQPVQRVSVRLYPEMQGGQMYVLTEYLERAMAQAICERLEDGGYASRIPTCPGVIAFGTSRTGCMEELRSTLEDWVLPGIKMGHAFPVMAGIDLNQEPVLDPVNAVYDRLTLNAPAVVEDSADVKLHWPSEDSRPGRPSPVGAQQQPDQQTGVYERRGRA